MAFRRAIHLLTIFFDAYIFYLKGGQNMGTTEGSRFEGSAFGFFWRTIVSAIVSGVGFITLGFVSVWAMIWLKTWVIGNTFIEGKQLKLEVNLFKTWVKFLVWMLLCVVTLGIYACGFLQASQAKYFAKHTSFQA
jgi:uncharacterized membrane protein YjgN (DUF898 family)